MRNNILPEHYKDFIRALNNQQVEYLIIGGYALGAHGHVRGTNDLDIFIHATDANATRLIEACKDYGIAENQLNPEMFLVPKMIGIGDPPMRIEILKNLDVVDFAYAFQRSEKRIVDGVDVNVVGLDDLILLKQAALRDRQLSKDSEDLIYLKNLKNRQR